MKMRLFLLFCMGFLAGFAGARSAPKMVKVYFFYLAGLGHPQSNTFDLKAAMRPRDAANPEAGSLQALLKGPTAAEKKAGLASPDAQNLGLVRITHTGSTYRAYFRSIGTHGWAGDMSPSRFKTAVQWTLRQFAGVRTVVVYIDGDSKFEQMGG